MSDLLTKNLKVVNRFRTEMEATVRVLSFVMDALIACDQFHVKLQPTRVDCYLL